MYTKITQQEYVTLMTALTAKFGDTAVSLLLDEVGMFTDGPDILNTHMLVPVEWLSY